MCLYLRADYITGNGSYVPVGKQKEECSHRYWLEYHRPMTAILETVIEGAVRNRSLDEHRMGAQFLVINYKLGITKKMQAEQPTPKKQARFIK